MSIFEKYFNKEFEHLKPKEVHIDSLLQDNMMLINGDFYGIQKFIFEGLATKNASKVLRAKSAFIQLYMITLSEFICHKLNIDTRYILNQNAGKFEILSPKVDFETLNTIQKIVDSFFINKFYGLSGIGISAIECTKNDFTHNYKEFRKKVADTLEFRKYNKFDLINQNPLVQYDTNINNQTLCKICNLRKIQHIDQNCEICDMFIDLGNWLVNDSKKNISSKNDLLIELENFYTVIPLTSKIKSYVPKNDDKNPLTFEDLSQQSCNTLPRGLKSLGILKADIDGMSIFIKNSDITTHFNNFDLFSNTLDSFFSEHIPIKIKQLYPNIYTVFAGGDDLFLVGSWDMTLELARWIEEEFKKFVKSKELTISFGIAIAKPSIPISYIAEYTEHLLDEAKAHDGKDAISLFGETVKWSSYKEVFKNLNYEFENLKEDDLKTAFLYRLLEFCEMSKKVNEGDIQSTIWKSKLRYSFSRNNEKLGETFFKALDSSISNKPKETKMFLSEFIYKKRD